MEYSRARGALPPELNGLLASQLASAIDEANLGLADKRMAMRYLVERMPQIDIAVEMGYSRKTIGKRLKAAVPRVTAAAQQLNLPQ